MNFALSHGMIALRHMAVLLSLRLLPFAVCGLVGRSINIGCKLLIAAGYAALPVLACYLGAGPSVLLVGIGAAYYGALCLGANQLSGLVAAGRVTRGAALVLIFVSFLLAPGVMLPGTAIVTFLVVGWELALSSYSYCVETSRPGARPAPMSECLFFLLVNPTLFYGARGTPLQSDEKNSGFNRAGAGAVLMLLNVAIAWPLADYLHDAGESPANRAVGAAWLGYGVVRFLSFYAAHSGLASINIGLMRRLGWRVPERYCYPLVARSPTDFWRRWNTYVRVWLEAYVFLPIAREVARRTRRRAGQVASAVATLAVSGLIHDGYAFAGRQTLAGLPMTQLFLAAGLLLVIWRLAAYLGQVTRHRFGERTARSLDVAEVFVSRFALASALVGAAIVWG